jgi:hypothetical protein
MLKKIQRILNLESIAHTSSGTPAESAGETDLNLNLNEAVKDTIEVGGKIVRYLDYKNDPNDPEVHIAGYGLWKLSYLKRDIQNDLNSLAQMVGRAPASQLLQILSDVEGKKMWSNHVAYRLAALAEVEEFLERPTTKRALTKMRKTK